MWTKCVMGIFEQLSVHQLYILLFQFIMGPLQFLTPLQIAVISYSALFNGIEGDFRNNLGQPRQTGMKTKEKGNRQTKSQ